MASRIVAIVNPMSGNRDMLPLIRRIGELVEERGRPFEVAVTQAARHATELSAQLGDDVHAVLVCGGDGTVCEVVNGLLGRAIPMAILEAGTANLLARELEMPTDPAEMADTLLNGEPFACDIGVANDRRFLAVTGVGFDAECVARLTSARTGHITMWTYFWPVWQTFWRHRFPPLRVEADGVCVFEGRGFAMVGNVKRYSAGFPLFAHARYDDGLLDLAVFPCTTRTGWVGHASRVLLRRHLGRGGTLYQQCRRVQITSPEEVLVEVDGDVGGELPVECSLLPGAARFLRSRG